MRQEYYRFSSLIMGIVRSTPFEMKVKKLQPVSNDPIAPGKVALKEPQ